jgi:hypothetical protein
MSVINLNDLIPPAPAGFTNIKWQADNNVAPRNVSAYVPGEYVCEEPSGVMDGLNKVFTLTFTPTSSSLLLAVNGVVQNPGPHNANYALSGSTITYTFAPLATDNHNAWYSH